MAAPLVRGHALRLRLPAHAALRNRGHRQRYRLLAGEGLPLLYRVLLLYWDCGRLPVDPRRNEVALRCDSWRGRDGLDVTLAALPREVPRRRLATPAGAT